LVYLLAMLSCGGLSSYLAGWQHPLAYTACGVFAFLCLLSWSGGNRTADGPDTHAHGRRQPADLVFQTLVHCLPIFLIAGLGVTSLGNQAMATSGFTALRPRIASKGLVNPAQECTLLDLYASDTPPTQVTVVAMAYTPTAADLGKLPNSWHDVQIPMLLYRFEIMCCAADASPIYAIVTGIDPTRYPNGTWLRVTGTITRAREPINLVTVAPTQVDVVPVPEDPYLTRGMR
jgi:hypothetical protein